MTDERREFALLVALATFAFAVLAWYLAAADHTEFVEGMFLGIPLGLIAGVVLDRLLRAMVDASNAGHRRRGR